MAFVGRVPDFLQEIQREQQNYGELTKGTNDLEANLVASNDKLKEIQGKTDWTNQGLKTYAPAEMAVSDLSYDTKQHRQPQCPHRCAEPAPQRLGHRVQQATRRKTRSQSVHHHLTASTADGR